MLRPWQKLSEDDALGSRPELLLHAPSGHGADGEMGFLTCLQKACLSLAPLSLRIRARTKPNLPHCLCRDNKKRSRPGQEESAHFRSQPHLGPFTFFVENSDQWVQRRKKCSHWTFLSCKVGKTVLPLSRTLLIALPYLFRC